MVGYWFVVTVLSKVFTCVEVVTSFKYSAS
jgi:hypothetical protein